MEGNLRFKQRREGNLVMVALPIIIYALVLATLMDAALPLRRAIAICWLAAALVVRLRYRRGEKISIDEPDDDEDIPPGGGGLADIRDPELAELVARSNKKEDEKGTTP